MERRRLFTNKLALRLFSFLHTIGIQFLYFQMPALYRFNFLIDLYNDIITIAIVCTGILLCLVTSTFCYTNIYIVLHHHQTHVQVHDDDDQEDPNKVRTHINITRYKKTVSSAIWVQMTLVVCYHPFGIATMVVYLSETYPPSLVLVRELTLSLLTFNSSLNPILYCWKIRGVRKAVKEIIRKLLCSVKLTVPWA